MQPYVILVGLGVSTVERLCESQKWSRGPEVMVADE